MQDEKNYRVGWVIPNQIGALTHYSPEVTLEEFQDIGGEAADLFTDANEPFHVIIDNRIMNMAFLPDLATLKRNAPYMANDNLRYIIMVKPNAMEGSASDLADYNDANVTLTYVDTLDEAVTLLKDQDDNLRWHEVESDFFPNATFK